MEVSPLEFHRELPGYSPTPLISLPGLARELGVGRVFVKDESSRLGLPAFKILGASYAIARLLSARVGAGGTLTPNALRERLTGSELRLVAATDGNHGRAVAHVATLLGLCSTIFVPSGISREAKVAIVSEGADLVELPLPYDDVVTRAAAEAGQDSLLVQDTSWPGYSEVPAWIVEGYTTLLAEIDAQLGSAGLTPSLVAVPVGVGSLAQAVVAHYRSSGHTPAVVSVEPEAAPALLASLHAGEITPVATRETVMTGLNCGTVSASAWSVLSAGLDRAVAVDDDAALRAVADLAALGVDSGPCGAATLAGVRELIASGARLPPDAVVVLLSTEGRAANPKGL